MTYTPPFNRSRALLSAQAWTKADGLLGLWVGAEAFAEFYPVAEETVVSILGLQGWRRMTTSEVEEFVASLDRLFESMEQEEQDTQSWKTLMDGESVGAGWKIRWANRGTLSCA